MLGKHLFPAVLLAIQATTASPILPRASSAVSIIEAIMPLSTSCAGRGTECDTATQAAPFLISAMQQYGVRTAGEIAGLLSLVAYESVQMQYKHNVSPGRPGQGTSNMMEIQFVLPYAQSISALASQVKTITGGAAASALSTDQANAVLALVTPDEYNFGSAPWFYSTQCSAAVKTALQAGTTAGFAAYMGCVGVSPDEGNRESFWQAAQKAFGLSG